MGSLYENIYSLCRKKGIRPGKMCDDLSLSRGLMTDLKKGRKKGISAATAHKIAEYFGVPITSLFGEPEPQTRDAGFAGFYGEYQMLSEEDRQTVRDLMRILNLRREERENK